MNGLPDPTFDDFKDRKGLPAIRILSDRGIKQAIEQGYLEIEPSMDLSTRTNRLQPATIDLKLDCVGSHYSQGRGYKDGKFLNDGYTILNAGKVSWVEFEDFIKFNNPSRDLGFMKAEMPFFDCFLDGRSSLLRLGVAVLGEPTLFLGLESTIFNSSQNNINLKKGERIAQAFICVSPFADTYCVPFTDKPILTEEGDKVRSLEMGVQATTNSQLKALSRAGLMKIERNGFSYTPWNGLILMHASKAFRTKKIEGGIDFAERDKYKDKILEEVDINRRYNIREGEHLIVEVAEKFDLSPHVGVSILNNFASQRVPGAPKLFGYSPIFKRQKSAKERVRQSIVNCSLNAIRNSWIDPGYKGMMTVFPKLLGKSVKKGDIVGYAQVFYFPKGVEVPYGSSALGSHYQAQKDFQVVKG